MSLWRVLKLASYALFLGLTASTTKLLDWAFAKDRSASAQSALDILKNHWGAALIAFAGYALLCGSMWVLADIRERLAGVARLVPVFVKSANLQPRHLNLANYHKEYLDHPEYRQAMNSMRTNGRVMVRGRAKAGKTRMAFNLARRAGNTWVLRTREDFVDWSSLDIPNYSFLYRPRVLWIIDDLDKLLGKASLSQGLDFLESQSQLRVIVTCRSGEEWSRVQADPAFCSFVEAMTQVDCTDFSVQELVQLAAQTKQAQRGDVYDGTPGTVFLDVLGKRNLLLGAPRLAQSLMRALYLLRELGIYSARSDLIEAVTNSICTPSPYSEIEGARRWLAEKDFITSFAGSIVPRHDVFVSKDVVDFYEQQNTLFLPHLQQATQAVLTSGTVEELNSVGYWWGMKREIERALACFDKAASLGAKDALGALVLINKGVALGRLGRSEDAIAAYDQVIGRYGAASEAALREQVASALFNKGVRLGELGRSNDAIAVYDQVIERYGSASEAALREQVAQALVNKGVTLGQLGRSDDEIAVYDQVIERYGAASEAALREQVAKALVYKGVTLGQLGRSDDAIAVYDQVIERYGAASEAALREQVASALFNKGVTLGQLGRTDDEIAVYNQVIERYGADSEAALREQVAKALFNKGVTLGQLNRNDEAIAVYDQVVERYGAASEAALREQVAKALVNKGVTLGRLGRSDDKIAVYDQVIERYGAASEAALREQVAKALVYKGVTLGQLNRNDDAIAVYDQIVERYGAASEAALREQVAKALVNKGVRLGHLGRSDDEIAVYDQIVERYGAASQAALREQVAKALFNKGVRLGQLGRSEDAIAACDQVIERYGAASEAALREQVAKALFNKGVRLGQLGRTNDEIAVYNQVIERYGAASEAALREQVAKALVNKGVALGKLNRNDDAIAVYDQVIERFAADPSERLKKLAGIASTLKTELERTGDGGAGDVPRPPR